MNCTTTLDLMVLYFVLYSEEQYNLKLPIWTKKVYPDFLENSTSLEYKIQTFTDEMLKSGAGHLMKKIVEDSKAKIDNNLTPKERKLFLYSGHEFNIIQILASLKLFDGHVPNYASYIILELHKINNQFGFKVFYQDYSQEQPKGLRIPGCEQFCDFHRFLDIILNILPKDNTC